jgi:hypothetical protein
MQEEYLKYTLGEKWDCSKNPHRHSERSEESHVFLFKSKNQKIRSFGLRPQDDTKR